MAAVDVRRNLVDALRLDLVGPGEGPGLAEEILPEPPSRWYLTGFLVPIDADEAQRSDETGVDELDTVNDAKGLDDAVAPETAPARRSYFPSSVGMSFLVKDKVKQLQVAVRWGDYKSERPADGGIVLQWRRTPRSESLTLDVPGETAQPVEQEIPNSGGLKVAVSVRPVESDGKDGGIPKGTRSVSVFVVNRRKPSPDEERDTAFAFQAQLEVHGDEPFVPRPNLRSLESQDWDECVADLQYCEDCEYAVGHNVSTDAILADGNCKLIRTTWIPQAEVERVAPTKMEGVELS
jgi:hypothetical protein